MSLKKNWYFYVIVFGSIIALTSPYLLSEGMFMDGLIYASIAKNLAEGIGTFWNPYFTQTLLKDFHEHPTLAIGIHSLFYDIFGYSIIVDKMYSIITYILISLGISLIWKEINKTNSWFPLLLWFSIPLVIWALPNNMLENSVAIFTTFSILFYLKSTKNKRFIFIFISGLMLFLGFLSKGFVAFFPLSFPFIYWLVLKNKTFTSCLIDSVFLTFSIIVCCVLLFLLIPESFISLQKYFEVQVLNSLKNVETVSSRFYIVKRLFLELIPILIISAIIFFTNYITQKNREIKKISIQYFIVFILLGLTAVLPIMISMKQSGFYILASFPFFAIGFSILFEEQINIFTTFILSRKKINIFLKILSILILAIGITSTIYHSSKISRDQKKVEDVKTISRLISKNSIINIDPRMYNDWSLHAYFSRYNNISLDPDTANRREYILLKDDMINNYQNLSFDKVPLKTKEFKIFKRKKFEIKN